MRNFYDRYLKHINIFAAIAICLAAALLFAGFLFWISRDNQKKVEKIQEQVEQREQQEESSGETMTPTPEAAPEQPAADASAEQPTPTPDAAVVSAAGISCRGDDFMDANDSPTYAYPVILQQLLAQNGKNIPVENKGLYGAGTLSHLRYAGVSEEEIQAYIAAHTASGGELAVTETSARDFTPEELVRTDQSYVPVLFMGFYGGWHNDVQELIAQQEKVLATYSGNSEQYLILGYPNTGSTDGDNAFDSTMTQRWGEHYVSLRQVMQGSIYSYEGQQEMAGIVYQKLSELGYLG